MWQLANIFQRHNTWSHFNVGCYVMIILMFLSSAFAVADNYVSAQKNEYSTEQFLLFNIVSDENDSANAAILAQISTQDECTDCHKKCCPCCSNTMFTLVSVSEDIKVAALLFDSIEPRQIDSPYYSLLRPPKDLKV